MAREHLKQLERHLEAVRRCEPTVRALVSWDAEAARERAGAISDGPLAGWALGVKDIFDVKGLSTRCGTDFLSESPAERNAAIVDRFEALGAYVFSKVVTTVFAYLDPGPTTNPWNPAHTPGGSSMGSAAAVAAGMVRIALGSQTIGSVARPAAYCGVVGFKPTYERMPQQGMFPFSPSVDTAGLFTANVADMQTACMAVFDQPEVDVPPALAVGVVEDLSCEPADGAMLGAVREVAAKLRGTGVDARPTQLPPSLRQAYENHRQLIAGELALAHREWFERHGAEYPPKVRELILKGQGVSPAELQERLERRRELETVLDGVFEEFDVLLTPGAAGAAPKGLETTGDPRMSLIFTHTRTPALTLPARLDRNRLPLGVQLAGRRMRDAALLAAAVEIESVIGFHERPMHTR